MKAGKKRRWSITSARRKLPALMGAAAREPQWVYRWTKLVAAVVGPDVAAMLRERGMANRPRIADALAELRRICAEENYQFSSVRRTDRRNAAAGGFSRYTPG